jgi:microcin C transport system substrate-binding protein
LAFNRRHLLQGGAVAAIAPALGSASSFSIIGSACAQTGSEPAWRHGLSLFGNLKYPADFKRFDYVNPDAPKGGVARMIAIGTFDNFNVAVAGIKGSIAPGEGLIYERLMENSQDEVATEYGLLAEAAQHPDDFAWVVYRLRK